MNNKELRGGKWYSQSLEVKQLIRERDNFTCQLCGEEGYIVDHIVPWRMSHDSTLSNLRVLCHACNLKTRRQRIDANPFTTIEKWYNYIKSELAV